MISAWWLLVAYFGVAGSILWLWFALEGKRERWQMKVRDAEAGRPLRSA